MTAKAIIEELQTYPPNTNVGVRVADKSWFLQIFTIGDECQDPSGRTHVSIIAAPLALNQMERNAKRHGPSEG